MYMGEMVTNEGGVTLTNLFTEQDVRNGQFVDMRVSQELHKCWFESNLALTFMESDVRNGQVVSPPF
jgi:hypothetical protein